MVELPIYAGIVDDEYLIRQHIIQTIDWKTLNTQVLFEAENGEQALSSIDGEKPEILIVDINMPGLNGIELAEKVHRINPECVIIILTGFNDFEYVQGALRAGVMEYLEKPLDKENLEKALAKAGGRIEKLRSRRSYMTELENRVKKVRDLEQERFTMNLLFNRFCSPEAHKAMSERMGWNDGDPLVLTLFSIDSENSVHSRKKEENRFNAESLYNIINEVGVDFPRILKTLPPDGCPVVIGNPHFVKGLIRGVRRSIWRNFKYTITTGSSGKVSRLEAMAKAYREAREAQGQRYFSGGTSDYQYPLEERYPLNMTAGLKDLIYLVKTSRKEEFHERLEEVFQETDRQKADRESIDLFAMELISRSSFFLEELRLNLTEIIGRAEKDWSSLINCFETKERLKEWLHFVGDSVIQSSSRASRFKSNRAVQITKDFIRLHYADPEISLKKIAEEAGISPSYLSKIFKNLTGKSVIEYLCDQRLQEAMTLLEEQPDLPVYAVSEGVGFSDPLYFSKVFKRRFGVSPRKIRKKGR